jgi:hypothetical protein
MLEWLGENPMVKKRSKKKDNNILYAGIIVAVLAVSCLAFYETEFNIRADMLDANWNFYLPIPPEGSIVDQSTCDEDDGVWHENAIILSGGWCYIVAQDFQNDQDYLTGFGIYTRSHHWGGANGGCIMGIAPELPDNPYDYDDWLITAFLPYDNSVNELWRYVWVETPYIYLPAGQTHYIIVMAEFMDGDDGEWEVDCLDDYDECAKDHYTRGNAWTKFGHIINNEWDPWEYDTVCNRDARFFTWTTDEPPPGEGPDTSFSWFSLWWLWLIIVAAIIIAVVNYLRKK